MHAAIEWARSTLLRGDPDHLPPGALLFLLQECTRLTGATLRSAVEQGLTRALHEAHADADPCRRIEWVRLLADAALFSDDPRLADEAARALPAAIDLLEMQLRRTYEPGDGLVGASCETHLRCAWALLEAYDLTGRLPYAMLAEELLRHATRHWWDEATASFGVGAGGGADAGIASTCAGLRVASRLAALHADPDYLKAAVIGPGDGPVHQARRLAATVASRATGFPGDAGEVGQGLAIWFALESDLQ